MKAWKADGSVRFLAEQKYGILFVDSISYETGKPLFPAPVLRLQAGLKPENKSRRADAGGIDLRYQYSWKGCRRFSASFFCFTGR
jgi:hypothetical protein